MLCGLSSSHELDSDNQLVTDPHLFKYAKRMNPDMRSTTRVCVQCYKNLRQSYVGKLRRFRQRRALANSMSTTNEKSSSTVKSSLNEYSSSYENSSTNSEPPVLPNYSSDSLRKTAVSASKRKSDESIQRPNNRRRPSNNSSLDDRPTTSAAAAAAQRARELRALSATSSDNISLNGQDTTGDSTTAQAHIVANTSSDDESQPGINILRGRRLPHIQPAPRRQRVQLEPVAMDMYLQGLTGG